MTRTKLGIAVVLTVLAAQCALAQGQRGSASDPAEWVPRDAIAYIGVTDVDRVWSDFKETIGYKQMMDKDLAEVSFGMDVWGKTIEKLKKRLSEVLDTEPDALKNPFAGRLAFYVAAPPGGSPDDVEPVMIAGVGDAELMQKYFDAALSNLKETADKYEEVSAAGQTIHLFTTDTEQSGDGSEDESSEDDFDGGPFDEPHAAGMMSSMIDELFNAESMPPKLAVCLADDRLIVAGSQEHVRDVLTRTKGDDTLVKTDDHRALLEHLKPTGEVRMLVNLPRVFELARAEAGEEGAGELGKMMSVIGAGSLRSVVGHMRMGARSYDNKIELLFLMSGERSGLAKLLSMENRPVAPPPAVSASTSVFVSLNIDPPRLWNDILHMIGQHDQAMADEVRASLRQETVDYEKELINNLAGPLMWTGGAVRPYAANSVRMLLTIGHRNREAITGVIGHLPIPLMPRDFQGTQIYESPMATGAGIAVTNDLVLAGTTVALEGSLTASEADALADDPVFRKAQRVVPKEAWFTAYWDSRRVLEALIELSKQPPDPITMGLLAGLQMGGMDLSDEKVCEKMLEYAQPGIVTISTTPDGVRLTMVSLQPQSK